jgi:hypothetical protein
LRLRLRHGKDGLTGSAPSAIDDPLGTVLRFDSITAQ